MKLSVEGNPHLICKDGSCVNKGDHGDKKHNVIAPIIETLGRPLSYMRESDSTTRRFSYEPHVKQYSNLIKSRTFLLKTYNSINGLSLVECTLNGYFCYCR